MELFSEDFINGLSDDPKIGLFSICDNFFGQFQTPEIKSSLEVYALLEAYISANDMEYVLPSLENATNKAAVITSYVINLRKELQKYVDSDNEERLLEKFRTEFKTHVGKVFVYEFSEGDLTKIQGLLNALREQVVESSLFEEKHRRRLLQRLERLQQELHKKQSDLDHFWGLIGDAGVAIGKFGEDSKPFVDRIKQITDIVWRTQSRAEELPSDSRPAFLSDESNKD